MRLISMTIGNWFLHRKTMIMKNDVGRWYSGSSGNFIMSTRNSYNIIKYNWSANYVVG